MGGRGEWWVVAQGVLLALLALAPGERFRLFSAGALVALSGGLLALAGALALGPSLTPFPAPAERAREVYGGVYGLVRHPIYTGVLLVSLGFSLATASPVRLAITAVLALFFDRKARREEGWLRERYPGYEAYRARVKRFIPGIY
ncbi:MAG: isoprenylcysteine carboxylmethyltransferase family protein [Candidatus Baltobacteraceae bacterium]|jgi:protein-S-isoprenylcysteine O-methyltransferase Ste14